MIDINAVHMSGGGFAHEHIESLRWRNPDNGQTGETIRSEMVKWIRDGGQAYVVVGNLKVSVLVVDANPPYVRTFADGKWQDNLLALPRF